MSISVFLNHNRYCYYSCMKTKRPVRLRPLHFHIGLASVALIGLYGFIASMSNNESALAGPPAAPSGKTWQLSWADEFNGSSVDTTKWNVENNTNFGASNHEDQCYRPGNVNVSGGALRLTAQRETVTCGQTNPDTGNKTYYFTSGLVTSRAQGGPMKFKFKQGYVEARIESPKGNPYWPALWLVSPNDGSTPGWPDYGEFDILENYGARPDITTGAFHYKCTKGDGHCKTAPTWYNIKTDSAYGGTSTLGTQISTQADADNYSGGTSDYQTYGFLWEGDKISWFVNGRKYRYFDGTNLYRIEQNGAATLENSISTMGTPSTPFSTIFAYDHSIILNLAVGGDGPRYTYYNYTGYDTAGGYVDGNYAAINPGSLEVDYVRVYQLANAATPIPTPAPITPKTTPAPTTAIPATTPVPSPTPSTNETVKVVTDNATISGGVVLSPVLATDPAVQATVSRVEYYINGKLAQTINQPPFRLDTRSLANGKYDVTEKIIYKDGRTTQKTARIEVLNAATKDLRQPLLITIAAVTAVLGLLVAMPFTRRLILIPVQSIRRLFNNRTL